MLSNFGYSIIVSHFNFDAVAKGYSDRSKMAIWKLPKLVIAKLDHQCPSVKFTISVLQEDDKSTKYVILLLMKQEILIIIRCDLI